MNQNRLLFIEIETLPPRMHHNWKEIACLRFSSYQVPLDYQGNFLITPCNHTIADACNEMDATYSLCPKMIVLLPGFFGLKTIVRLTCPTRTLRLSQIFLCQTFYIKKSFLHCNFRGHFRVVVVLYFKSHTYNYSVHGQRALISPKLETRLIILGRREYHINKLGQ